MENVGMARVIERVTVELVGGVRWVLDMNPDSEAELRIVPHRIEVTTWGDRYPRYVEGRDPDVSLNLAGSARRIERTQHR